jgi:hypothetical protein
VINGGVACRRWAAKARTRAEHRRLGQQHPDQVGPSLARICAEAIAPVAAEAFEVVEDRDEAS